MNSSMVCKVCKTTKHVDDMCNYTYQICQVCYDKADEEYPDLDHWDLYDLTK